jgi:hypothetical protein
LDEEAVSWYTVSGLEEDHVTNDEVRDVDSLGGSVLASEDGGLLVHDLRSQVQELSFFSIVAEGLNHSSEGDSEVNGYALEPLVGHVGPEASDEGHSCENKEQEHQELVALIPEHFKVGADSWKTACVFSEKFLSAIDILDVTDNSSLSVGGQFVKKTVVEPDTLENDQTLSFFALVFGRDVVPSLEEKLELLGSKLKDRRT